MAACEPKWFTNRGQMIQVGINALALIITGKPALKDMLSSHFFSFGAVLFYCLVGLVILSFVWMVRSNRAGYAAPEKRTPKNTSALTERITNLNLECFTLRSQLADANNELSRRDVLATLPEAQEETIPLKQKLREAEDKIASIKKRFLDDAPSLIVEYGHIAGIQPMLTLINDSAKAAVSAKFDPLFVISKEPNGGVFRHELMTIPSVVSLIEGRAREQCELIMKDFKQNSICPLEDILSRETSETVDTVTLNYDDSVGREFVRDFTLRRHIDGSVGWKPGPIRLRGPSAAP